MKSHIHSNITCPYHDWSDETFDWKGLNDAIDYMYTIVSVYGRCFVNKQSDIV